jgi:alpha-galactosidase
VHGLLERIKSKGMIAGLWLEMEVCGEDAQLAKRPDSWFLMRNGKRVGGGDRMFLNYTNPEVRDYIHGVIDMLVGLGMGFIKNDYNDDVCNGDDRIGSSAADGQMMNIRAFYDFIDEVRAKHPTLIIENCGSGAMRQDYGILSHFHLQSSSDQEIYYYYPSILSGSLACVLPEQLGVWAYPMPLLFLDKDKPEVLKSAEYQAKMADGEETIFNMVSGMCGNMYLSGHLEAADDLNMRLIKEGVALYKCERKHIHNSHPIWPIGFTRFNDTRSWVSVGMASEDEKRVFLAVWRLGGADEYQEIPLKSFAGIDAVVKMVYPAEGYAVEYSFNRVKGTLTVRLPRNFQGRMFEITVR